MRSIVPVQLVFLAVAPLAAVNAAPEGYFLDTIFTINAGKVRKVVNVEARRRRLQVEIPAPAFNGSERDLVRTLIGLQGITYANAMQPDGQPGDDSPLGGGWVQSQIQPIFDAGDAPWYMTNGERVPFEELDGEGVKAQWKAFEAAYDQGTGSLEYIQLPEVPPGEALAESYGAFILLFRNPSGGAVLSFRGTFSTGDFANIVYTHSGWFADRARMGMQRTWEFFAQHPRWGAVEEARGNQHVKAARLAYVYGSNDFVKDFPQTLHDRFPEVDRETYDKQGYWPLVKMLTDTILDEDLGGGDLEGVYFTGHSQGGAQAALMSMYIEKSRGIKVRTITVAAVGGACYARDLGWPQGGSFLDDVDPYVHHDQITDYSDAYDFWGNMDVDPGTTCYYGASTARPAYKYCKEIQGYTGTLLQVAQQRAGLFMDVSDRFARCRYLTHAFPLNQLNLIRDETGFLREDGTTDGGCYPGGVYGGIPSKEDPDGICAPGGLSRELKHVGVAKRALVVIVVLIVVGVLCLCWCCVLPLVAGLVRDCRARRAAGKRKAGGLQVGAQQL